MERAVKITIHQAGEYILIPAEDLATSYTIFNTQEKHDDSLSFGSLIRFHRNLQNLSKKELALKSGLKPCQVSNFENDKKKPRPISIDKLSSIFGKKFEEEAYKILATQNVA